MSSPTIGSKPVVELTARELLAVVRPARRVAQGRVGQRPGVAEWRYTVGTPGTPHIVPLARQALAILREVHTLTGHHRHVFPKARYPKRERAMSDATLWGAFRALDIPRTG